MPNYQMMYNMGLLQGKAYRTLEKHLSATLAPYDLSIPEWKLMGQLYDWQELSCNDLVKKLDLTPTLITTLLKKLQEKHFVHQLVQFHLTEKGESIMPQLEIEVHQTLLKLLAGTSIPEKLMYIRFLVVIVKNGEKLKDKN